MPENTDNNTIIQLVTFKLGQEEYAVDIQYVQEIIRIQEITQVPDIPDFVEGIINLRGKIIPIIDLQKRFKLKKYNDSEKTRIVVVEQNEKIIGLTVNSVKEVLNISTDKIEPPPSTVAGIGKEYLKGIGNLENRLLILLDLNSILLESEQSELEKSNQI